MASDFNYAYNPYGSIQVLRRIYKEMEYESPKNYINLSRYKNTDRIFDSKNDVYYHSTVNDCVIPETVNDTYVTIIKQTENRLDIIANNVYGYAPYWWILAIANDVVDPFDIPMGTKLRCPPLSSLYLAGSIFA